MFDTSADLQEKIQKLETETETASDMLECLVHHLLRNYEDDLWCSSTRELLEEANDYLGYAPIVWNIDESEF